MKRFKVKILSLSIASTVLLSSTPIFAATTTANTVKKNSTSIQTTASKFSAGEVHLEFNYGVNGGPEITDIIDNEGGIVQKGDIGIAVKELQALLNWQGASISIDGIFGSDTYSALKSFQSRNNIYSDGIAGHDTLQAFARYCSDGNLGISTAYRSGYITIYDDRGHTLYSVYYL